MGRGVCALYILSPRLFFASLGVLLLGSVWIWVLLPLCSSSLPPAKFSGEWRSDPIRSATPFLLFLPNKAIISDPNLPEIRFIPLPCDWLSSCTNRTGGFSTVSWHMPAMEVLVNAVRQAPRPCCNSTGPDLSGSCRLDQAVGSWDVLLVRGSGSWADHPPWICVVSLLSSAASGREVGTLVTCVRSLMENQKFGVLSSVGCCPLSKLQDLCYLDVAIFILKLRSRGIKCINLQCFFCIPKMRADDDLAKDGDSCSFGSIHRWQVRESSLLIPRYNERGSFRMSSVMRLRNLQLIHLLPHVHMPARLPEESLALWRACSKEAFEDFNCGCAPELSQLARHKTRL